MFPGWHEEPECREQAVAAYRAAAAARLMWSVPHERIGRELLREERPGEALAEFDAALLRAPADPAAQVGRWRALVALGNRDAAQVEIAHAAGASSPESLGAAREGYVLLGQKNEADAIGARILDEAAMGVHDALWDRRRTR